MPPHKDLLVRRHENQSPPFITKATIQLISYNLQYPEVRPIKRSHVFTGDNEMFFTTIFYRLFALQPNVVTNESLALKFGNFKLIDIYGYSSDRPWNLRSYNVIKYFRPNVSYLYTIAFPSIAFYFIYSRLVLLTEKY